MKKNTLLILIGLLIHLVVSGQIKQGAHFLGGSFSVSRNENESNPGNTEFKTFNSQFSPAYGYAVKKNLIIGGDIVLQSGKNEGNNTSQRSRGFGAGFFLRKYLPLGKGFYLFGQGRFGVGQINTKTIIGNFPANETNSKQTNVGLTVYPGVSYAINNKLQLEVGLNDLLYLQYTQGRTETENSPVESSFNSISIGSNIASVGALTVGLRILINN